MSLTAIIFLAFYVVGLYMTFRNPFYGVLTYMFEWHFHPPYYWWGDEVPDFVGGRWSFAVAALTLVSWVINRRKLAKMENGSYATAGWLLLIVLNMMWVSIGPAILPDVSWDKTNEMFKVLVSFLLITTLVRKFKDYELLIWLLLLWATYWGIISWQEGGNRDIGVMAPNTTEENAVSAHIMAIMPFFGVYFLKGNRWGKVLAVMGVVFGINLIILANSRAAMLGFAAIGFGSLFLFKGKVRFAALLGMVAAGFLFTQLSTDEFKERQSTETYDDGSATSRIHLWTGGWEMWKDHPFGVGGGGFIELSMSYVPEIDHEKSQHNTFVAVFTDWGFIGFILYMGLIIHTMIILARVKRKAKRMPMFKKYIHEATAIQLAIIGISGAGMFHSRQYAEIVYWLCSFTLMLNNILNTEIETLKKEMEKPIQVGEIVNGPNGTTVIPNPIVR